MLVDMIWSSLRLSYCIYDFLVLGSSEEKMKNPVMLVDMIWSPN